MEHSVATDLQRTLESSTRFCQYVTIVPTANVWNEFAVQKAFLRQRGQLIEDADIIIGSTAIVNNMIMVTENVKHIGRLNGIVVENWG